MKIIPATEKDADPLTALAMRSKGYWGYGDEQIEAWREDLTITAEYISRHPAFILIKNKQLLGFYSFEAISKQLVELDNLFVEPAFIGKGVGGILISDFLKKATDLGFEKVRLDADPNARPFYKKYGFNVVDHLASSIPGRYLPVMEMHLSNRIQ